jgi:hypothetical protein
LEEVGIPTIIQTAIMASHDPGEKGVYPDWADRKYVSKHRELKIGKLFERHRNAAIPTGFMKSWITDSEDMPGQAKHFSNEWYNPKRRER